MKNVIIRRKEATERQLAYANLTVQQRIAKLDKKLEKGKGAKKQRAKLAKSAGGAS